MVGTIFYEREEINCLLILVFERWFQILLDDVKVSEQLLDLVFYLLIVLGGYKQVYQYLLLQGVYLLYYIFLFRLTFMM